MDLGLDGRCGVVTGAAGAIARETARNLLAEGCRLILTDLDADELAASAGKLGGGDRVRTVVADLSSQAGADRVREEGARGEGGWTPSLLFHAAGVTGAKGDPLIDITDDDWAHAWNTDFLSAVRVARTFLPAMRRAGWGRAVFVVSENVAQPYPEETVYDVAKSALLSFAKSLSMSYARHGVLVNCVAPAFIATDMTDAMMEARAKERGTSVEEAVGSFLDEERPHLALHRRGRPEEVGFVAACLLSARASFVNGANWRVDGGSVQSIDV